MAVSAGLGAGASLGLGAGLGTTGCRSMLAQVLGPEGVVLALGAAEGVGGVGAGVALATGAGAEDSVDSPHPVVVSSAAGFGVSQADDSSVGTESG